MIYGLLLTKHEVKMVGYNNGQVFEVFFVCVFTCMDRDEVEICPATGKKGKKKEANICHLG